jgi:hypothetical protein
MSAAVLYCYRPQRKAVLNWMQEIGAIISSRSPCGLDENDVYRLQGLEDVNFVIIDGMEPPVPERIWEMLRSQGAIIMHIDDHYARVRHRVRVEHLPSERHADA